MARLWNKSKKNYPPTAEYIGRGSPYGNPYIIGRDGTREEVIALFEKNILPELDVEPLRNRDLLCHCHPKPCHGQPILRKLRATRRK